MAQAPTRIRPTHRPANRWLAGVVVLVAACGTAPDADETAAAALTSVGAKPPAQDINKPQNAAWTSVARVLLNLHETITRY